MTVAGAARRFRRSLCVATLASAVCASAIVSAQPLPPMQFGLSNSYVSMTGQTPKSTAEARTRAEGLLRLQHAEGEFENITRTTKIELRHLRTGIVCRVPGLFAVAPPTEVEALSSSRKFLCINFVNRFQNDLGFSANTYSLDARRGLSALATEIRAEVSGLHDLTPNVSWAQPDNSAGTNASSATAELVNGKEPSSTYVFIVLRVIGGWIVWDCVRGTLAQKDKVDFAGNEMMRRAVRDFRESR